MRQQKEKYYLRPREEKKPIKITGEIVHIEPLKINVNHALENLSKGTRGRWD